MPAMLEEKVAQLLTRTHLRKLGEDPEPPFGTLGDRAAVRVVAGRRDVGRHGDLVELQSAFTSPQR